MTRINRESITFFVLFFGSAITARGAQRLTSIVVFLKMAKTVLYTGSVFECIRGLYP